MKIKVQIPQSWNDCSDNQLTAIASLMASGIEGIKFDYRCFCILIGAKWFQLKTIAKRIYILANVPMSEIKPSFEYIYKKNNLTRFPAISIKDYFSPLPQVSNLTIAELAVADDLHIKFRSTRNTEFLHYLAATLYVHQQQPRPPFDKNDLSLKVKDFQKLPMGELLVIEQAFAGCKEHLASKFKKVFPKPTGQNHAKPPTSSGFPALILQLSGGKFGTHEQTSRTNCYTFFSEFENLLKEQKNVK